MGSEANEILIDPDDAWLLEKYSWTISSDGYAVTNVAMGRYKQKTVLLHHCIMGQPIWEGDEIDHINRVRLDDRRSNLRYVTKSEQAVNRSHAVGRSGERCVYLEDNAYKVVVKRRGVNHYLGRFDTLDEAVAERDEWLHKYEQENIHG